MRTIMLALLLASAAQADAQDRIPGRIVGRVTEFEDRNKPIAAATITLPDGKAIAADATGGFTIPELAPGSYKLTFEMLGFGKREQVVEVVSAKTTEVLVALSKKPIELPPIIVTVRSRWLETNGFYERLSDHRGRNTVFTAADIEKQAPQFVTDLLRRAPGLRIHHGTLGSVGNRLVRFNRESAEGLQTVARKSIPGCEPALYVDGARYREQQPDREGSTIKDWNFISPMVIEAIEVYHSMNQPVQYKDSCGVILIWTKKG